MPFFVFLINYITYIVINELLQFCRQGFNATFTQFSYISRKLLLSEFEHNYFSGHVPWKGINQNWIMLCLQNMDDAENLPVELTHFFLGYFCCVRPRFIMFYQKQILQSIQLLEIPKISKMFFDPDIKSTKWIRLSQLQTTQPNTQ